MAPGPEPGLYLYDWTVPAGTAGQSFGVETMLRDPASGLLPRISAGPVVTRDTPNCVSGAASEGPTGLPTTVP